MLGLAERSDRIAIVASWSDRPTVTRSLDELVRQLVECGYETVLVRASDDGRALDWPDNAPNLSAVIRRPNVGYDFGSWSDVLQRVPSVRTRRRVILVNDSMIGPFSTMGPLLESFESGTADAWGAVMSSQFFPHLQSFLLGFRNGVLDSPVMREFWKGVKAQASRDDYVAKYELGLNRALFSEGFTVDSAFPPGSLDYRHVNPTLDNWRELLQRGFPFVKRAIMLDRDNPYRAQQAAQEVEDRFGERIDDWM